MPEPSFSFCKALLLAFADSGVYLYNEPSKLIAKARSHVEASSLELKALTEEFLRVGVLSENERGYIGLSFPEALKLATSFDGHTPVPDKQALDWVASL